MQMGVIAKQVGQQKAGDSPIRVEISKFIYLISYVAIFLGITFLIVGFVATDTDVVRNIVFCIGIIVANVPEGLLATVTVSLALTAKRMFSKNVLVKNLEAVETLGRYGIVYVIVCMYVCMYVCMA